MRNCSSHWRAGLRAGIEFLPKDPYFSTDIDRIKPTLDSPRDMTYNYRQLDGVVFVRCDCG